MKTVGQILREAREKKGLTIAQAAEGTHSKSMVIQALEKDDFSRFPAPIYTRGFIKLYAELLGLDAPELISMYQARNAEADKVHRSSSVLKPSGSPAPAPPPPAVTPELNLPPAPEPPGPAPKAEFPPPPVSRPAAPEPELPFDRPPDPMPPKAAPEKQAPPGLPFPPAATAAPPPPVSSPPPPVRPAPARTEPPRLSAVLPAAVKKPAPQSPASGEARPPAPRRKGGAAKPALKPGPPDEFALEVKGAGISVMARQRAASLVAMARARTGRLPWMKILPRAGIAIGVLLAAWLAFFVTRSCAARRHAAPRDREDAAPAYRLPAVPEPPPLFLPDKLPKP